MRCKYNVCEDCGYKTECEIFNDSREYSETFNRQNTEIIESRKEIIKQKQENAELKAKLYGGGYEAVITKKDADIYLPEKTNLEQRSQLKKATEIIRDLYYTIQSRIVYTNNIPIEDEMARAKEFIQKAES